jgi:AraC family transcriptional regulator, regulatory protein of adaptative response / methylated-DNA-[protein]-cysteine methyltransferase
MDMEGGDPDLARFQEICRYIEAHWDEALPLARLSQLAGLSPSYFQRRFKAIIGVSPKQYLEACRLGQLKQELQAGNSVTVALYEAGFGASSRLYEKLDSRLGMTPKQYRSGGKGLSISYASAQTTIGTLMMGATDRGLCFIQFGKTALELLDALRREYPQANLSVMGEELKEPFEQWIQALEVHLKGGRPHLDLPLDIQGTAFQLKVWTYLQKIPYGEVQSYTEVAKGIGQPKAARAVASACAANHLAIAIPCHRVIRGNGELGGYRWGLTMKRSLIEQERQFRHIKAH